MKHVATLKVIVACYICYMTGGFLSAVFMETDNRIGAIIAIGIPTVVAMLCFVVLTQQVQPARKKLPVRRTSRVVRSRMKVVR